jgi:hypothetical protein
MNFAKAEVIDSQKIVNKEFGPWIVSCKEDVMLGKSNCKLFAEVVEGTTLFVNPNNNDNKIILISKDIMEGSRVIFRIDRNDLIGSGIVESNAYNIINIGTDRKREIFEQLKVGNVFYVRFSVKDDSNNTGSRQVTARLDLADFVKALDHYNTMMTKSL